MMLKLNALLNIHSLPYQRMSILKQLRQNRPLSSSIGKQLLVDVSIIIREDAHTGIQRVVRALLFQLFLNPPIGYQVLPVYCTRKHKYRYADRAFVDKFTISDMKLPKGNVVVANKDIFFGLDLVSNLLPHHMNQLLEWKLEGVKIHILVYDMLPHLYPQWFTPRSVKNFRSWLRTIAVYADQLICISDSVKNELSDWLNEQGFRCNSSRITTVSMGSDISLSFPSSGVDTETTELLQKLENQKFILMVGTIEPRKGYDEVLNAMETLWNDQEAITLVIVGKPGWKTVDLQARLISHKEQGNKLFWLKNISDQSLQKLYEISNGVLAASYGEGFGLPIIEAMHYGKPLLVRDIPVFREIGLSDDSYFNNIESLATQIKKWIRYYSSIKSIHKNSFFKWEDTYKLLLKNLGIS